MTHLYISRFHLKQAKQWLSVAALLIKSNISHMHWGVLTPTDWTLQQTQNLHTATVFSAHETGHSEKHGLVDEWDIWGTQAELQHNSYIIDTAHH